MARMAGNTDVTPPNLAQHVQKNVCFTDLGSLCGLFYPEQLATRLSLQGPERYSTDGAVLVMFNLRDTECTEYTVDGHRMAYTEGGARQWLTKENVAMSSDHFVYYVESHSDPGEVDTTRPLWFLANPNLEDETYWELAVTMSR
jgi:hypothetical protein